VLRRVETKVPKVAAKKRMVVMVMIDSD